MKSLLIALMLTSGTAFAFCPYDQNYTNCMQVQNQIQQQQRQIEEQKRQFEQQQRQIEQQQRLNQMNYNQAQQPKNIRQQCYQNVFGVIECR